MAVIGTNISALRSANASAMASNMLSNAMERLSTGKRINSAKDDAAGLAISSRMTSAVKSMAVAVRNANDGISLAQTAEGSLGEVTSMLQRMKELATQSANGTLKDTDRAALQVEMTQLTSEVNNVAKNTTFNGVKLLDGSFSSVKLQTGINSGENISMSMIDASASTLGLTAKQSGSAIVSTALASGDLKINNEDVGVATKSAKAIASAINAITSKTGVTASADSSVTATVGTVTSGSSIKVGGTTVTFGAEKTAVDVAAKINTVLGPASDIQASTNEGGQLVLRSKTGDNIAVDDTGSTLLSNAKDAAGVAVDTSAAVSVTGKVTVEANAGASLNISGNNIGYAGLTATSGTLAGVSIASQSNAESAMGIIDAALDKISAGRGNLGAVQNRLQSTVNTLTTTTTNLTDAKSRIEDADFSTESTNLAKAQILSQASTAMLAQANQSQQSVLKLLQ